MPLNDRQIDELARAIDDYLTLPALIQLAAEIDVLLSNIAPDGSVQTRALTLLKVLNGALPPRDRELLEAISAKGLGEISASLRAVVDKLLTPTYQPPNARAAVLLGRTGFFGRNELRERVREFTDPSPFTSRVLVVQGDGPGGKTYSWEFLRHLAKEAGAVPLQLRLNDPGYEPRSVVRAVGQLLRLNLSTLPQLADEPQSMRMNALMAWFQGELIDLKHRYWLVIDDLDKPTVTPEVKACAYALASIVEVAKPDKLWMALLGFNDTITDREMRDCVRDVAAFPSADMFAKNFESLAAVSPVPLTRTKATEYAQLLFSKYELIDRTAMEELTRAAEGLGQKLLEGQQL